MTERPILFSAEMVRALLAGTKSQTRRVFKLPRACSWYEGLGGEKEGFIQDDEGPAWWHVDEQRCPYGSVGDRLWVREAWRGERADDGRPPRDLDHGCRVWTEADGAAMDGGNVAIDAKPGKLRPGIFMPRWASRITLEITGVRVERVQDISEADAKAEGPTQHPNWPREFYTTWRSAYRALWNQINGAGAWDANPWVWVLSFSRKT